MSFSAKFFLIFFAFFGSNCFANKGPLTEKDFIPNTFKAYFKQSYKSSLSGKEKITKGYIEYFYPGRVRFEVTSPDKTIFVSNPQTTWYYNAPFIDGEPGEVLIKKTGKMVISKFFDLNGSFNFSEWYLPTLNFLYLLKIEFFEVTFISD